MIARLQGPTSEFATNGLPQITAAVIQLQNAAESLERLVNEIQSSPTGALGKAKARK
jgi:phospholipid/cholesterol/gamma-HCH transport system substrate-binding protein